MVERTWTQFGSTSKYSYNTQAFKVIDSEDKAYWLGFLYADGAVSKNLDRFSLSLAEKDKTHVGKFRDFIAPDRDLEYQGGLNSYRIYISSKEITADLIEKGCTPQKSLTLQPPPEGSIPEHLIRHFIRGYFDGDGCAMMKKNGTRVGISILGTEEILEFIVSYFKSHGVICRSKIRKPKEYNAYVWANEATSDIMKVYNILYDDCTICLERKRDIMQKVFSL